MGRDAYDSDLVADNFDLGSPEVLERDDAREASAIEHIARVGQDVNRQTDVPYLRPASAVLNDRRKWG